jgi:hypothetical protein
MPALARLFLLPETRAGWGRPGSRQDLPLRQSAYCDCRERQDDQRNDGDSRAHEYRLAIGLRRAARNRCRNQHAYTDENEHGKQKSSGSKRDYCE